MASSVRQRLTDAHACNLANQWTQMMLADGFWWMYQDGGFDQMISGCRY